MAYAASSDFEAYIDFDSDVTQDSDLIDGLLARATSIIDAYCGRVFTVVPVDPASLVASDLATSDTRYFDAARDVDGMELLLDRDLAYVVSITNGDGTTVTTDQYVLLPFEPPHYSIKMRASSGTTWTYDSDPEQSIAIAGWWSFNSTTDNLPDILHACVRLTHWLYKQRESQADLDRPLMVAGSGNVIMPARLPEDVKSILDPYRIVRIR
jgi:hypothetical protein